MSSPETAFVLSGERGEKTAHDRLILGFQKSPILAPVTLPGPPGVAQERAGPLALRVGVSGGQYLLSEGKEGG